MSITQQLRDTAPNLTNTHRFGVLSRKLGERPLDIVQSLLNRVESTVGHQIFDRLTRPRESLDFIKTINVLPRIISD